MKNHFASRRTNMFGCKGGNFHCRRSGSACSGSKLAVFALKKSWPACLGVCQWPPAWDRPVLSWSRWLEVLAHTVCLSTHCFLCNSVISIVQACTCNLDPFVTWCPFGDRGSGRCQARESSMVALTIVWAVPARLNTVSVLVNIVDLDLVRRRSVIRAPSYFPTILFLPFEYCSA